MLAPLFANNHFAMDIFLACCKFQDINQLRNLEAKCHTKIIYAENQKFEIP